MPRATQTGLPSFASCATLGAKLQHPPQLGVPETPIARSPRFPRLSLGKTGLLPITLNRTTILASLFWRLSSVIYSRQFVSDRLKQPDFHSALLMF